MRRGGLLAARSQPGVGWPCGNDATTIMSTSNNSRSAIAASLRDPARSECTKVAHEPELVQKGVEESIWTGDDLLGRPVASSGTTRRNVITALVIQFYTDGPSQIRAFYRT